MVRGASRPVREGKCGKCCGYRTIAVFAAGYETLCELPGRKGRVSYSGGVVDRTAMIGPATTAGGKIKGATTVRLLRPLKLKPQNFFASWFESGGATTVRRKRPLG